MSDCGLNEKPPCSDGACRNSKSLGTDGRCHDHCGEFNSTCCSSTVHAETLNSADGCYGDLQCKSNVCIPSCSRECGIGEDPAGLCYPGNNYCIDSIYGGTCWCPRS